MCFVLCIEFLKRIYWYNFTKQLYFQESIPACFYYYRFILLQFLPNHAPPNATVVYSGPTLDVYFLKLASKLLRWSGVQNAKGAKTA